MEIEWADIAGFEGAYQVSLCGKVRSLPRMIIRGNGARQTIRGRILKYSRLRNGYLKVSLVNMGVYRHFTVHKLVAEAFLGDRPKGYQVAHKNGIKTDNRKENLYYATPSENMIDSYRLGERVPGEGHPTAKLSNQDVREIIMADGAQAQIAARYGIAQSRVSQIKRGQHKFELQK